MWLLNQATKYAKSMLGIENKWRLTEEMREHLERFLSVEEDIQFDLHACKIVENELKELSFPSGRKSGDMLYGNLKPYQCYQIVNMLLLKDGECHNLYSSIVMFKGRKTNKTFDAALLGLLKSALTGKNIFLAGDELLSQEIIRTMKRMVSKSRFLSFKLMEDVNDDTTILIGGRVISTNPKKVDMFKDIVIVDEATFVSGVIGHEFIVTLTSSSEKTIEIANILETFSRVPGALRMYSYNPYIRDLLSETAFLKATPDDELEDYDFYNTLRKQGLQGSLIDWEIYVTKTLNYFDTSLLL